MLLAAFIISLLIAVALLPLTFNASAVFDECGFSLNIRVRLAHIITLFGWDSGEEGLDFLLKKRARKEKKKKSRINKIIGGIFNPRSLLNIKGMTIARFEVRGGHRNLRRRKDRHALWFAVRCFICCCSIP
ncbi:MAG TPA: hypothetical protein PLF05_04110 [Thermoclostridium sp.]|nr:hypothetical protein [Thermoclostridium sp.]